VYAFFRRGVVQMMNAPSSGDFFGSEDVLERVYALGGNYSFDYQQVAMDTPTQQVCEIFCVLVILFVLVVFVIPSQGQLRRFFLFF
jgi:hypothetical protein